MRLYARMRWAIFMLCAFVSAAGAQITPPVSMPLTFAELQGRNVTGDMLSSFTLNNNRPDTLPPFSIAVTYVDTIGDSTAIILGVSTIYGTGSLFAYRDTIRAWSQILIPKQGAGNGNGMPDSLVAVIMTNSVPAAGERFELRLENLAETFGRTQYVAFSNDTIKGTLGDTSAAIYTGRGGADVAFGFQAIGDTASAVYTLLYNSGFGWGMSVPADTLADSTFTWQSITDLRFVDLGELMPAPWIKIIRKGTRAADTVRVKEQIRVEPR